MLEAVAAGVQSGQFHAAVISAGKIAELNSLLGMVFPPERPVTLEEAPFSDPATIYTPGKKVT